MKIKIGLVGEAPSDVSSIKNLLEKRYSSDKFDFFFLLQNFNGSNLDSPKTKRFLRIEYERHKPEIVIFIRDLDSILPNRTKLYERKNYFTASNRVVDKKGIPLLHIYEIEALILQDIETFNILYNKSIPEFVDVMQIAEPKEVLRRYCKEYSVTENEKIFSRLNFERLLKCSYFERFIKNLDKVISKA